MSLPQPATTDEFCNHFNAPDDPELKRNQKKAKSVFIITLIMMVIEIYYGHVTESMSLLADGYHMGTHAAALGIALLTYVLANSKSITRQFNFGGGKIIFLGGFTSSLFLFFVVFTVVFESYERLMNPRDIAFDEALAVAVIGLIVNIVCAFILGDSHEHGHDHHHGEEHDHSHHHHGGDHNIKGAYLHVIADAITSVGAILALLGGRYLGWVALDPVLGIVSSLVIVKWSWGLFKETAWELLDGRAKTVDMAKLRAKIEQTGANILDLHVWRVAPKVLNCELVVVAHELKGTAYYRSIIEGEFKIHHSVIEERLRPST